MSHKALVRSAGILGFLTLCSRVLGFLRDILMALQFGTSLGAEAFVVSFKIPNLFRDLVGEGAMNAAIVPVLSETKERKGEEDFRRLAVTLIWYLSLVLLVIGVMGVCFAPWIVGLSAPGFCKDREKFALTVKLTRLMFPFIFFIGLSALFMGILNSMKKFAASAFGPILLNLAMLVSLVFWVPRWGVHALVAGALFGGLCQCLVQIPSFKGARFRFFSPTAGHPDVLKIFKLLLPRLWGSAVYQTAVFVDTILASFYWIVGAGGQSALYYSSRLFQLPLAVFGVSIAQAALPTLSAHSAREDHASFKDAATFAMCHTVFTTLPAAVGLAVFSDLIIRILFERGAFTSYSTRVTSDALFYYSFGLVGASLVKMLVTAFYAMQDTRTPVKTAFFGLLVNVVLNLIFMWRLKIGGLALSTSIAATLNAVLLYAILSRRIGGLGSSRLFGALWKSLCAAGMMALVCVVGLRPWIASGVDGAKLLSFLRLGMSILAAVVVYYLTGLLVRSEEALSLNRVLARRNPFRSRK